MRDNYNITTRVPLHPAVGALNSDFDPESPSAASNLSHAALSFVHGGLAFGYPNLTPYPSRINSLGASLLNKTLTADPLPAPYPPAPTRAPLPASATPEEIELNGTEGPYWARDWAEPETEEMCAQVEQVLNSIGCAKMFMGHTVRDEVCSLVGTDHESLREFQVMLSRCNSKIVLIDTVRDSQSCLDADSDLLYRVSLMAYRTGRRHSRLFIASSRLQRNEPGLKSMLDSILPHNQQRHVVGDA